MPRITLSNDLKTEIKNLPDKEKDKLLLRLIPTNELLVEQLEFRLLENEETTELRRAEVILEWEKTKSDLLRKNWRGSKGPMSEFRWISATLNRHVKVTKDSYAEVVIHLSILRFMLELLRPFFQKPTWRERQTSIILLKRLKLILGKATKLHVDYRIDFIDDVNAIRKEVNTNSFLQEISASVELDFSVIDEY